jgi:hypothetical protein
LLVNRLLVDGLGAGRFGGSQLEGAANSRTETIGQRQAKFVVRPGNEIMARREIG